MSHARRLVVVLGMSRSGTSTITRGLRSLGVELGTRLLPPGADNPRGYWEDEEIMQANDEFLTGNGYAWHSLRDIDWSSVKGRADFSVRIKRLLEERMTGASLWGFKDPRTYLLLPLWQEIFVDLGIEPLYILPLRNPKSIVHSLQARNGFVPEQTYYLWLKSMISTLGATKRRQRCLISYENVLREPERELRRAARHLGLETPSCFAQEIEVFRSEFLTASLDHAKLEEKDLAADTCVPPPVKRLYSTLAEAARSQLPLDDAAVGECCQKVADEIIPLEPLWRPIDAQRMKIDALVETHERSQQALEAIIKDLDADRKSLQAHLAQEREWREWFQAKYHRVEASLGYRAGEKLKEMINRHPRLKNTVRGALEKFV